MEIQAKKIGKSIRRVSLLMGMRRARIITLVLLIVDFVQRVYFKYPVKGLYIMMLYVVLPFLIGGMIKPYVKETLEQELPLVQQLHGYSKREFIALSITTVIVAVMLGLWGMGTSSLVNVGLQFRIGPLVMALVCIGGTIIGYYYNRKELIEKLKNNAL